MSPPSATHAGASVPTVATTTTTTTTGDGTVPGRSGPVDVVADPVDAALALADAFDADGRLLVVAAGAPDHAHHVAVEFVHPVIAGLPALPAEVIDDADVTARTSRSPADVVLSFGAPASPGIDLTIPDGLSDARSMASYHLLWELVHVALDRRTRETAVGDATGFLYPFLDDGGSTSDPGDRADEDALRAALADAAVAQHDDSIRARENALARNRAEIAATGGVISRAAAEGARVHVVGNGGSATDAARMVRLLTTIGVPATSLAADYAVVTALANDLGAERVFARQVDAFVRPGDVVVGWSTSGTSANVVAAFERATTLGATCVGSCGYGGDALATLDAVSIALTVDEQSVHRIQEAQADLMGAVVDSVAERVAPHGAAP